MSAANLDIYIEKGATFRRTITLLTPEVDPVTLENIPLDLTGCTARATLKYYTYDKDVPAALFVCTVDADPTTGKILLSMADTVTEGIPTTGKSFQAVTRYVWDMELVYPTGTVERLFNGFADVSPRVSKVAQYV